MAVHQLNVERADVLHVLEVMPVLLLIEARLEKMHLQRNVEFSGDLHFGSEHVVADRAAQVSGLRERKLQEQRIVPMLVGHRLELDELSASSFVRDVRDVIAVDETLSGCEFRQKDFLVELIGSPPVGIVERRGNAMEKVVQRSVQRECIDVSLLVEPPVHEGRTKIDHSIELPARIDATTDARRQMTMT